MTFREAFIEAATDARLSGIASTRWQKVSQRAERFPRVWRFLEHAAAERYRAATGLEPPAEGGDWRPLIKWLIENLPAILKIVALILALL